MNKRKLLGAVLAGGFVILYYGLLLIFISNTGLFTDKDVPLLFIFIILFAFCIPIIGVSMALVSRIKEIKNGEEEEAKKY